MRLRNAAMAGLLLASLTVSIGFGQWQLLTNADILEMMHSGVSGDRIIRVIETVPEVKFDVTPEAVLKSGISKAVLDAMTARVAKGDVRPEPTPEAPKLQPAREARPKPEALPDPPRPAGVSPALTEEWMQAAYRIAQQNISGKLKSPYAAHFAPIEEVGFSPGGIGHRNDIVVRLYVDSQNSFGAMLRLRFTCYVGPERPDHRYKVFCRTGFFERE